MHPIIKNKFLRVLTAIAVGLGTFNIVHLSWQMFRAYDPNSWYSLLVFIYFTLLAVTLLLSAGGVVMSMLIEALTRWLCFVLKRDKLVIGFVFGAAFLVFEFCAVLLFDVPVGYVMLSSIAAIAVVPFFNRVVLVAAQLLFGERNAGWIEEFIRPNYRLQSE